MDYAEGWKRYGFAAPFSKQGIVLSESAVSAQKNDVAV
jgi:hypothetical protein